MDKICVCKNKTTYDLMHEREKFPSGLSRTVGRIWVTKWNKGHYKGQYYLHTKSIVLGRYNEIHTRITHCPLCGDELL